MTWTPTPVTWDNSFLESLFGYEWELTKSPAGAYQWKPKDGAGEGTVPDPQDPGATAPPTMLTTDLSLRLDPVYEPISRRFLENPGQFADAFARAWFKLTHRDMGPVVRYLGPEVPSETLIWQDPVPQVSHELVGAAEIAELKRRVLAAACRCPSSCRPPGRRRRPSAAATSAAAPTGAHPAGAAERVGGQPPRPAGYGAAHSGGHPAVLQLGSAGGKQISLADLIVLAGAAAVEKAARDAGFDVEVPFAPGRADASQDQTDAESFVPLEPKADGFRNYLGKGTRLPAEYLLLDKANLLTLSAPEMTVLVGGLRVLGANYDGSKLGSSPPPPGR